MYIGAKLDYGGDAKLHFSSIRDAMENVTSCLVKDGPDKGKLDAAAGGKAIKFMFTSLEPSLAADIKEHEGPGDEQKLQAQVWEVPDTKAAIYKKASECTLEELENAITRKITSSGTNTMQWGTSALEIQ